jgi:hypothetical protein
MALPKSLSGIAQLIGFLYGVASVPPVLELLESDARPVYSEYAENGVPTRFVDA